MKKYHGSLKFAETRAIYRINKITCVDKYQEEEKELILDQFLFLMHKLLPDFLEQISAEQNQLIENVSETKSKLFSLLKNTNSKDNNKYILSILNE